MTPNNRWLVTSGVIRKLCILCILCTFYPLNTHSQPYLPDKMNSFGIYFNGGWGFKARCPVCLCCQLTRLCHETQGEMNEFLLHYVDVNVEKMYIISICGACALSLFPQGLLLTILKFQQHIMKSFVPVFPTFLLPLSVCVFDGELTLHHTSRQPAGSF